MVDKSEMLNWIFDSKREVAGALRKMFEPLLIKEYQNTGGQVKLSFCSKNAVWRRLRPWTDEPYISGR